MEHVTIKKPSAVTQEAPSGAPQKKTIDKHFRRPIQVIDRPAQGNGTEHHKAPSAELSVSFSSTPPTERPMPGSDNRSPFLGGGGHCHGTCTLLMQLVGQQATHGVPCTGGRE